MKHEDIGYLTDPSKDYQYGLDSSKTVMGLRRHLKKHEFIAWDALEAIEGMTDKQFVSFKKGLATERKSRYAGNKWAKKYGAVLIPLIFLDVGLTAVHFKVPWGAAYIRMHELKALELKDGIVIRGENAKP